MEWYGKGKLVNIDPTNPSLWNQQFIEPWHFLPLGTARDSPKITGYEIVVSPIFSSVLYIPDGDCRISEPSTVADQLESEEKKLHNDWWR